ncbi:WD repeat-containing protein 34-like [Anneissia japonica]|uniref:WD repeat-containing protein 34-like n=1 Tax=Anneissia japonica TaxID=1529436 RepID=UPI0014256448|nr:WD repeat-containing protein 34-like [Anneissia japonica]
MAKFVDEALDGVEFKSCWKRERNLHNSTTQTKKVETEEEASQSVSKSDADIQTEDTSPDFSNTPDFDPVSLLTFLKRVEPDVIDYLDKTHRSHAFDGFDVSSVVEELDLNCMFTLTACDLVKELQCTSLSWNAIGSTIAVAYGMTDHQDWCEHKGLLLTWNLERQKVKQDKPGTFIEVSSCMTTLSFHPRYPAWIAGATFSGDVMIWDLGKSESLMASSSLDEDSHREAVSSLVWIDQYTRSKTKAKIMSVCSEGKVLIWDFVLGKDQLKLSAGWKLSMGLNRGLGSADKEPSLGVTCLSFWPEDQTSMVIGSESGGLYKCNMPEDLTEGEDLVANLAITFKFHPHQGPVYSTHCSPFHHNLFLSCSSDACARIHSLLESQPIVVCEPGDSYLFSARWSPVRPLVFAVGTAEGRLLLFDLKKSKATPVLNLEINKKGVPVYTLEFNHIRQSLLACGDSEGTVRVWRLSDELCHQGSREVELLRDMTALNLD